MCNSELRNVGEIPPPYSSIFDGYPCFNAVQSQVLDDILYTDDSVVVSAPTGAGKTAIFELAVVRLLIGYNNADISQQLKIVYICPIKSLCQERLVDWHKKFSKFGINCVSITGDSETVDFQQLIHHNLIISTPEKWDSITRKWKDNEKMVKVVKLFMIDEVHLLNEESRGSTLEVIVSRMKTVENSVASSVDESGICNQKIRFIALSATVPNVEDIAEWIGKPPNIKYYRFSEEMRPVKLKKIILGYNCNPKTTSAFKFDLSLNYKLQSLMMQYSEGKPTLIFCSTRKSVEMTAKHIVQSLQIRLTREQINKLMEVANLITDAKAKETLKHGVGYHHAVIIEDGDAQQEPESLDLPILENNQIETSTSEILENNQRDNTETSTSAQPNIPDPPTPSSVNWSTYTPQKLKTAKSKPLNIKGSSLIPETRHLIENLFRNGDLPILVTTSTLAMGVNLPAHLVIIKSTKCYSNCGFQDYTETAIHQMVGRAGRPQFDTSATALILTTNDDKHKFEQMVGCGQPIESNLHRHLTEHLNAEVVLRTITDLDVAMQWLASTFLYVRARKNPRHYGLNVGLSKDQINKKLLDICQIDLNKLVTGGMITMDQNIVITPTTTGQIMAKYYVAFETMKLFTQISGTEILIQILALISKCHEFSEMRLRVNDKKTLNLFNKNSNRTTIRFPLNGRIKTWDMKVNCIIQAVLGNLDILDHSLLSESLTIMRNGARIAKCLVEYLGTRRTNCYSALLNTIILGKCFQAKLWENSPYVSKQLSGIGSVASSQLANAGKTTFQKILESNPRDIEMTIKRKPPMGNVLIEEVRHIPRYKMTLEKVDNQKQLKLIINLVNGSDVEVKSTINLKSVMILLVGNNLNEILLYEKYQHSYMMENNELIKFIRINTDDLEDVHAHFISEDWVGIDCTSSVTFESSDKASKKKTANNGKNKDKKEPTYIQMFLDMYMKTKKKSTDVVQKKQKVKDNTLQANKETTKDPKKLDKKTCVETNPSVSEGKISKKTSTNAIEEGEKAPDNCSAFANTNYKGIGTSRQVQAQDRNEDVADEDICECIDLENYENAALDEISSHGSNVETNEEVEWQKTNENVHEGREDCENVALDEISNTSSTSLFLDNPVDTMDDNNVNRVPKVEGMKSENAQGDESPRDNDDHRLVIDEGPTPEPDSVINFEQKLKNSLIHLEVKYKDPAPCKSSTWTPPRVPENGKASRKGEARKRPAIGGFKFPNKKRLNHQLDSENSPDSTDETPQFRTTNMLQPLKPSNTNRFIASKPASLRSDMRGSSQSDVNKENAQKNLSWRSPLVYSPVTKFSPKINFPSCSTSRGEAEPDVPNETANETFETTSSRSTGNNLTLNIQRTPRQSKSASRLANNKHKFPLRDKDYSSNQELNADDDLYNMCSSSLMQMTGLDKVSTATRTKKVEASPTLSYYSQLLAQPEQSQKQNTETASQRGPPDQETKENVPNDSETSNVWDSSNASQNVSGDLDYADNYQQVDSRNPEATRANTSFLDPTADSSVVMQAAQQYFDLLLYHSTLPQPDNAALQLSQNSVRQTQTNTSQNEYLVQNPNSWTSNSHWCGNSIVPGNGQGIDNPYNVQASQNVQAGFVSPDVMGDRSFTGHPPASQQLNETFVPRNYPEQYSTQNTHLPATNVSREQDFSRLLTEIGQQQNIQPNQMNLTLAQILGDDLQRRRSTEYIENNLRNNPHNQSIYGPLHGSQPDFAEYGSLRGSQQHSRVVERTTGDANVVNKPHQSPSEREHFSQVPQMLERENPARSQNDMQDGSNLDGSSQAGPLRGKRSRSKSAITSNNHSTQDAMHNRSFVGRRKNNVERMLNRSLSYEQPSTNNFLQPQGMVVRGQHATVSNPFLMRNPGYPQSWGFPLQNLYHPNIYPQRMSPYFYNAGFNYPYVGQFPHFYPTSANANAQGIPDHDKQYMLNRFFQSLQKK